MGPYDEEPCVCLVRAGIDGEGISPPQAAAYFAVSVQLADHPDATLEEHCDLWHAATGVRIGESTWCRMRTPVDIVGTEIPWTSFVARFRVTGSPNSGPP
jgi:hypothetical protein